MSYAPKKEIYYIEDDDSIACNVKEYLDQKEFVVTVFSTVNATESALKTKLPALVLVDWNLPDGRGDALCSKLRARWQKLPIILLTVRSDVRDVVTGFQNGADDYVTKPFELEVLYSRICALLRRTGGDTGSVLSCDQIAVDQNRLTAFCQGEEVALSHAEYQLLLTLMQNKGRTVTRERLIEQIWDMSGSFVNDNTLTVTVKRLREKLHDPACLKTIRSFGYRMEDTL
ncbi:MAG: response regulator transcription factor [Acetatifactor sp.]|nr:response regulator transcription factor [Acetatifactor sp.]